MHLSLDEQRKELIKFLLNSHHLTSSTQTNISSLTLFYSANSTEFTSLLYEPSLCVILQGEKEVYFGNKMYAYTPKEYLLLSTHIPANVRITKASNDVPFLGLKIKFSLEDIYEVLKNTNPEKLTNTQKTEKGLFFGELDKNLYDPISRLIKLSDKSKEDIAYLSPLIVKEIIYILVNDKSGYFLNKFAMKGSISNGITKIIAEIKNNFTDKLNIKELASLINISESSLYQNFKTITSMTPLQFQKKLRLEESKKLLQFQNMEVSEAAYKVGYESPSQFSREFSRMFGVSPKVFLDTKKEV